MNKKQDYLDKNYVNNILFDIVEECNVNGLIGSNIIQNNELGFFWLFDCLSQMYKNENMVGLLHNLGKPKEDIFLHHARSMFFRLQVLVFLVIKSQSTGLSIELSEDIKQVRTNHTIHKNLIISKEFAISILSKPNENTSKYIQYILSEFENDGEGYTELTSLSELWRQYKTIIKKTMEGFKITNLREIGGVPVIPPNF